MPIPDFQSTFLPILQYLADGEEHNNREIQDALEKRFNLSEEEKRELLPSGKQRVFSNRIAWGKSYLKQAGLIGSQKRGSYHITYEGKNVLNNPPEEMSIKHLMEYPSFREFREGHKSLDKAPNVEAEDNDMTPQEHIEYGYNQINRNLKKELLGKIKECDPRFFEQLVVDLLLTMGYGGSQQEAATLTEKGADEGIDGVINEDKLGLDILYVQAKRWANVIGRPEVQKFAGALHGKKAKKGIYITLSDFSGSAVEYVKTIDTKIVLINGEKLTELMIKYGVGVDVEAVYEIKKISLDYFIEE